MVQISHGLMTLLEMSVRTPFTFCYALSLSPPGIVIKVNFGYIRDGRDLENGGSKQERVTIANTGSTFLPATLDLHQQLCHLDQGMR